MLVQRYERRTKPKAKRYASPRPLRYGTGYNARRPAVAKLMREIDKSLTFRGKWVRERQPDPSYFCGGKCSTCNTQDGIHWATPGVHQVRRIVSELLALRLDRAAIKIGEYLGKAIHIERRIRECFNCGEVWLRRGDGEPIWVVADRQLIKE